MVVRLARARRRTRAAGCEYVGNVGTGFDDAEIERLLEKLRPLERETSPFPKPPKMPRVRKGDVVWVEPKLVAEVEFAEWTHDGHLRAPSTWACARTRTRARCGARRPEPIPDEIRKGKRVLRLSNLDKPFWPDEGITKGDLLAYYRDVAPVLVPHLRDRPFTMKRYPDGWQGKFFFQKDAPSHMPDWIPTVELEVSTRERPRQRRKIEAPLVNDELALLWMVNMGCIDLNTWYSRVDKPDRPDFVLFDLDPVAGRRLRRDGAGRAAREGGARRARARVVPEDERRRRDPRARPDRAAAHLRGHARSSPRSSRARSRRTHRGLVTTEWTKAKRRGVLIDANQNGEGKTIASVYSVRPKAGRAGLDAAALGRGRRVARPGRVHDGRRARARRRARRPVRGRAARRSSRSRPLYAVCASGYPAPVRCFRQRRCDMTSTAPSGRRA